MDKNTDYPSHFKKEKPIEQSGITGEQSAKIFSKAVTTLGLFAALAYLFGNNDNALKYFIDPGIAGLFLLGAITAIIKIIWSNSFNVVEIEEDENDEDEEEAEEEDVEDCEKCGTGLEVYDPKPLCAACSAEVKFYAKKNGVKGGQNGES